jgi:hypothetical protein
LYVPVGKFIIKRNKVSPYAITIPTKYTSFLLLKAQDITICTFYLCILSTTQQQLRTPTSRNNPRDMQQHSFNESF